MDIEKILQAIASDFNKTVEEIRDSNIDDIFQGEPDDEIGNITPIYSLAAYIGGHLPGYDVEIKSKGHDIYDDLVDILVDINLRKKLIDKGKDMGEGIFVKHKEALTTEIITLNAERGFDEPGFRKIGDILSKFKKVYDKIEAYIYNPLKDFKKQHLDDLTEGTPVLFAHHSYDVLIYQSAEFIPEGSARTPPLEGVTSEDMVIIEHTGGWRFQLPPHSEVRNLSELLTSDTTYGVREPNVRNSGCYAIGKDQVIQKMRAAG